jgi:hypothetical protein
MLDFPVTGIPRVILYGLLALWAGLLLLGLALGKPDPDKARRLPLGARMGLSVTLVIAALVWWRAGTSQTPLASYGLRVFIGVSLGFLGDLFMAGLIVPKPKNVIFGILSFGAGHIAYCTAFVQAARVLDLAPGQAGAIAFVMVLLGGVALWLAAVRNPAQGTVMNAGTLSYSLLLTSMGATAMMLALGSGAFVPLAVGGLLFITSDLILGSQIMRGTHFRSIGDVIWVTYTVAQMLIVYSSSAALHLLDAL